VTVTNPGVNSGFTTSFELKEGGKQTGREAYKEGNQRQETGRKKYSLSYTFICFSEIPKALLLT